MDQDQEEEYPREQQMALARDTMKQHDPANQDHGYERCEHCNYVRHPCEAYELAELLVKALERLDELEGDLGRKYAERVMADRELSDDDQEMLVQLLEPKDESGE